MSCVKKIHFPQLLLKSVHVSGRRLWSYHYYPRSASMQHDRSLASDEPGPDVDRDLELLFYYL